MQESKKVEEAGEQEELMLPSEPQVLGVEEVSRAVQLAEVPQPQLEERLRHSGAAGAVEGRHVLPAGQRRFPW